MGMAAVGVAEQVMITQDVDVKSDKNPLADPVETVGSNTQLEVLSRDGGWLRVRTPAGKEGFISQDDLPSNVNVAGLSGNANSGGIDTAAAGKGLQDDAEKYAKTKNLNTAPLDQMIAWGKSVSDKDLREFDQAGHVGPAKFRK